MKIVLFIILVSMPFGSAYGQKIYSWTDENGKKHYSQHPPESGDKPNDFYETTYEKEEGENFAELDVGCQDNYYRNLKDKIRFTQEFYDEAAKSCKALKGLGTMEMSISECKTKQRISKKKEVEKIKKRLEMHAQTLKRKCKK